MSGDAPPSGTIAGLFGRLERSAASLRADRTGTPDGGGDVLAAALVDIARHYGLRANAAAMIHGLPLVRGRLALEHAGDAARRAGLEAVLAQRAPADLADAELPVVVPTADGGCDLLWHIERAPDGAPVAALMSAPGQGSARVRVPFADLAASAAGRLLLIRPASGSKSRENADLASDRRGAEALAPGAADWFLPAFAASRGIYREAVLATIAINVLALAMPLFTMNVYDRVLPNAAAETLWALSIGVVLATVFDFAIKSLRARFVDAAGRSADVRLSNLVMSRVVGARLTSERASIGVRANTLRELDTLREMVNSATLTAFGDLPFLVLFLAMIAVVSGSLVLVPLASIPLVLALGWLTQARVARLTETQFRDVAQRNAVAVETLAGLESIKVAGAESWAASKWERAVADAIRSGNDIRDVSTVGTNAIFAAQTLTQIVMIIAGFYMVAAGSLTTGGLIAATMLAGRALQPLGQIAMLIARLHQARIAFRMLDQLVMAPQERPEGTGLLAPAACSGRLAFEAVTFCYDKDHAPALKAVTFALEPGERVAIVGGIGTGKTTALKLAAALHAPQSGRVLLDGVPVSHIDPAILRRHVGLALKDAELFHGTLRDNIVIGRETAGDEAILAAARVAGVVEWVMRLPKGFDTLVRERGAGLSAGQRQGLVLARTLLRDPRVLLLDEPTSDMDPAAESAVVRRLAAYAAGRTLLVVTHRTALLDLVDRIIVLDHGAKILDGPKASVLASLKAMGERTAASSPARAEGGAP